MAPALASGVKGVAYADMTWFERGVLWCRDRLGLRYGTPTFRYVLLTLTILVVFSGYFAYDLPGITSEELKRVMKLSNTELGMLFSVYALPNAFIPLLSGMFYTRIGVWPGVILISVMKCIGVIIVAFGAAGRAFPMMLLGRLIYGFVGDSLYVGVDVLATEWFKEAELGLAYGLIQSAGQLGSFAAFYGIPPYIHSTGDFVDGFVLCGFVAAIALAALYAGYALEKVSVPVHAAHSSARAEIDDGGNGDDSNERAPLALAVSTSPDGGRESAADTWTSPTAPSENRGLQKRAATGSQQPSPSWPGAAPDGARGGLRDQPLDSEAAAHRPRPSPSQGVPQRGRCFRLLHTPWAISVGLHHLTSLTWRFYAVLIAIAAYSGCFYTFLAFGNDYLQAKYGMDMDASGKLVSIISFFSALFSPLAGYIMDKRGGKEQAAVVCMGVSCIAFAAMGFTDAPVTPTITAAGIAYSILPCALYPIIADVVPEEAFTQVYAITNAAVNMVLMVSFYAAGTLSDTTVSEDGVPPPESEREGSGPPPDYTAVFYLFTMFTAIGTVASATLVHAKRAPHSADRRPSPEPGVRDSAVSAGSSVSMKPHSDMDGIANALSADNN